LITTGKKMLDQGSKWGNQRVHNEALFGVRWKTKDKKGEMKMKGGGVLQLAGWKWMGGNL